ncbi:DAR GTPase 3, chloroplastic [Capsicum chinense]|nr:DAR GTPase 3, chloroplastic [Capsicum chinense]
MATQLPGLLLNGVGLTLTGGRSINCRNSQPPAAISSANPPPLSSTIQVVGWKGAGGSGNENSKLFNACEGIQEEYDWNDLETELYRWIKTLRPVQWYPGHIAKTEKELKEQLKLMDVVIEVRDARIPMSTSHPQMDSWLGNRKRILVLNREDMISTADRNAWASYYANQGIKVVFSNGQLGMGALKLGRLAKALAGAVNVKRKAKGLLPRPVRAGVVGYPNVGKSSLVNRLLKRRMCPAAPRPGVTRELKWVRFGKDLELLDSPGIIPMRISDQTAAIKLAICDDIGERSYDALDVAAILVQMLSRLPTVGRFLVGKTLLKILYSLLDLIYMRRLATHFDSSLLYLRMHFEPFVIKLFVTATRLGQMDAAVKCAFVQKLAVQLFNADNNQAAFRILQDFRKGKFGWIALERPPRQLNHSLATIPLAGLGRNIPTLVLYLLYGGAELVMYIVMYISKLQVQ